MKQETPLQKLLSELDKTLFKPGMMQVQSVRHQLAQQAHDDVMKEVINKVKSLLPYEREVIETAFNVGESREDITMIGYEYFEQTFKTDNQ